MNSKKHIQWLSLLIVFLVFFSFGQSAWAATRIWVVDASGSWNDPANWQGGVVPTSGDDVSIPAASANAASIAITLASDVTVNSVTIVGSAGAYTTTLDLAGYTLNVTGAVAATGGSNADGDVTIDGTTAGSELLIGGNLTITGATGDALVDMTDAVLTIDGNLTTAANALSQLDLTGCDITLSGTWTRGAASLITVSATTDLTLDGTVAVTLDLTIGNGSLKSLTIDKSGALVTLGSATNTGIALTEDFTITDQNLSIVTGVTLTLNGDLSVLGSSSIQSAAAATAGGITFATAGTKTLTVAEDSYLSVYALGVNASVIVNTSSNFTVVGVLTNAGTLTATAGTASFIPPAAGTVLWTNSGALTLYNVLVNCGAGNGAPITDLIVTGDFTKIGSNNFAPTAGTVTFTNSNLAGKSLQVVGGTDNFFNLAVSSGAKVTTTSTFSVSGTGAGAINILGTGSFIADAGTITMSGANGSIDVASGATLEFNNLANSATTVTSSNFTIKGNLTTAGGTFTASGSSTITFDNDSPKDLNCGTVTTFVNLLIAENSTLETTTAHDFVVTGAGSIKLESGATFTQAAAGITSFAAAGDKNIYVADDATLTLGVFTIADVTGNDVATSDNFTVAGASFGFATIVNNPTFVASSPSIITFTGATVAIDGGNAASELIFHDIVINGGVATLAAGEFMELTGDITLNGAASSLVAASNASKITFNGATQQVIGYGATASIVDPAINLGTVVVNKTGTGTAGELLINADVDFAVGVGVLTLTDGILNLDSYELTLNQTTFSVSDGLINGATGTLILTGTEPDMSGDMLDATFTIDGEPTLYNLQIDVAATATSALDGTLTVNGTLYLNDDLTIEGQNLIIQGSIDQGALGDEITYTTASSSKVTFDGSGTIDNLSGTLFTGSVAPSLEFKRGETLDGNLTMDNAAATFTINTSTQYLDLSSYTLTLDDATVLNRVSGGIDADAGAVVLGEHASQVTIPANLFKDNEVYNLTLDDEEYILGGDLTILYDLNQGTVNNLYTNNNTLTIGPNVAFPGGLPLWVAADHVIGNLKMTVTDDVTVFPIGGGTAATFRPIALAFATAGSSQVVKVSSQNINPVYGKGGDPTKAVNFLWTITPEGTAPTDSVAIEFGWGAGLGDETYAFPARWNTSSWVDYRNGYGQATSSTAFIATNELSPNASNYPVNANALSGEWAVFVPTSSSDTDKDAAIDVTNNKLVIKNVTPAVVEEGIPFSVTVELQNQYGNPTPVTGTAPLTLDFDDVIGTVAGLSSIAGVIPVGSSSVTVNGFSYAAAGVGRQFQVNGTGMTVNPNSGLSPLINVIDGLPSNQVNTIEIVEGTTSATMEFSLTTDNGIIIAKAGSAITSADFPVDGVTYYASTNFGEGSKIGDAVVIYKGAENDGSPVTISGLAPKTTYYVRGFSYGTAVAGTEKYLTFASALNPVNFTTDGDANNDDDEDYGSNNTMATAKPIGANSPIKGTIKSATDEDWFSFTITNSAPNLRARLTLSADLGNYNVELYNVDGRRLRRGVRLTNNNENQVINELEPGTYLVRVVGVDGAFSADYNYTLQLTTDGNEIYSVTE